MTEEAEFQPELAVCPERTRKIVEAVLPGARILRTATLGPDTRSSEESSKAAGYGVPIRVDLVQSGIHRSVVLHSAAANAFGHDRRSDRAAATVLAADTFGVVPRHVEVLDVGAYSGEENFVSLRDTGEFYLLSSYAEGHPYADDLRHIAKTGKLTATDISREQSLVDYLVELHSIRPPQQKIGYERFVRDTLGSGEGIFGITDSYPEDVSAAPRARLERIEEACLRWRFRLRKMSHRLRRTHGDFHPFNVVFNDRSELYVLDASRGCCGDPADDVTCMAINYPFFSLGKPGAWRESFGLLWHGFWNAYTAAVGDDQLYEVVAPLLAWRGLVLASPTWYPELSSQDRDRVLSFVEDALAATQFSPAMAGEYFDT